MTILAAPSATASAVSTDSPQRLPASTYDLLRRGAAINPDALALSYFPSAQEFRVGQTWSFSALLARITQTANLLHSLGIGKDDVVAYALPNLPETHFAIWGGQAAGIVAAINPMLGAPAMAELLNAVGAKALITLGPADAGDGGQDLWSKVCDALMGVESLRHVVCVNRNDTKSDRAALMARARAMAPAHANVIDFHATADAQPDDRLISGRIISENDRSSFFCTGGTSGAPKVAIRRHGNEVANAWWTEQGLRRLGPSKSMFCGLPLFHVSAPIITGLQPWATGAHVVLGTPQGFRSEGLIPRFWEIVEHYRLNLVMTVPTVLAGLIQVPVGERDIGSLELAICGAAPLPLTVLRQFEAQTGIPVLEGYGMTETSNAACVNPANGNRRPGSVGLRVQHQRLKAVQIDADGRYVRDCAVDETGVLVAAGPTVFEGYLDEVHNRGAWPDLGDGLRWFLTGDLGREDADGYIWLSGRKKELIIRGGHNIDPLAIEDALLAHPAVQLAAAVARPDRHAGELPVAYVQLKPGTTASEDELTELTRSRITERAALPKRVHIIDAMPCTVVGKLYKPELKRREIASALAAALDEAGVAAVLSVVEDKARGHIAHVVLPADADEAPVEKILGQFAVAFAIARSN